MARERTRTVQIVVRVEPDLRDWLQAVSDENGRTLAQTVRFYLWKAKRDV